MATGARLAGKNPIVLMQNSGVGNVINPLASLNILYRIPVLLLVSWRGYLGDDAPEHLIMGRTATNLLETIGVEIFIVSGEDPAASISAAVKRMEETSTPVAAILKRGIVE